MARRHLLVVFHSQSGRAEHLALSVWRGARSDENVEVRLLRAVDACCDDLLWAQALVLVTPENFGALSGCMKELFDRVYYPLERADFAAMPYALVISAGNDGSGCARQLERILVGLNARKVQDNTIIHGRPDVRHELLCSELGQSLAAGLAMGIF